MTNIKFGLNSSWFFYYLKEKTKNIKLNQWVTQGCCALKVLQIITQGFSIREESPLLGFFH